MRRSAWVLSLLTILGLPTQAVTQSVRIGVLGGVSRTSFDDGERSGWESRTGYSLRGGAEIGPLGPLSILTEASWSVKGAERPAGTPRPSDPGSSFKLGYLSFGVLANYQTPIARWGRIQGSVFAGPTLGFLVDCRTRGPHAEQFGGAESPRQEIDCDRIDTGILSIGVAGENMEDSEFGLALGVQLRWDLGSRVGLFEARYDHGFSDVDQLFERTNRAFTVSAGFLFGE